MSKTIIISAGHSGSDPGAISRDGRHKEADLAQRLRNRIATLLRADGVNVLTDGSEDENRPLRDAIALLNRNPSAIAIEIHFNAAVPSVRGVEVLAKDRHKQLARELAAAIGDVTGSPLRGQGGWKSDSSGQHHRLAFCEAGGLIVEVEFISNEAALADYLKLETEVATSLANALRDAARKV